MSTQQGTKNRTDIVPSTLSVPALAAAVRELDDRIETARAVLAAREADTAKARAKVEQLARKPPTTRLLRAARTELALAEEIERVVRHDLMALIDARNGSAR